MAEYVYVEPARWPVIIYGDGLSGEIVEQYSNYSNEYGEEFVRMRVRMEEKMMARAGLTWDDLDEDDSYYVEYPSIWVKTLSDDPANPVKLVKCDFWGRPTNLTRENEEIERNLRVLERLITSLREENAYLLNEIDMLHKNLYEHDKQIIQRFKIPLELRQRGIGYSYIEEDNDINEPVK